MKEENPTTEKHLLDETLQGTPLQTGGEATGRKMYIESYGCQMNFSDSEIVASILTEEGYSTTPKLEEAELILLNTCSIREKAEQTVRNRLQKFQSLKKQRPETRIGVLGCMAERLKKKLLEEEQIVDMVVGPDAYKDLPNLLKELDEGREAVNVLLSKEETYGDIRPVRLQSNGVSAFVTITRGCDNMCTFCVVPFTRGRERSRDPQSIVSEVNQLWEQGYREVTLLGQNVDSYLWYGGGPKKDFEKASEMARASALHFSDLLDLVATAQPGMRIRFSTSNPQDMTLDVIDVMARHRNICNYIHLPVQSGSDRILKAMNRLHTREEYLELIREIRRRIPDCGISHDMIAGFPTETEQDHRDTLSLMEAVEYDFGFMFAYSERPGTLAARKMADDVPSDIKKRRLREIIELQGRHSLGRNQRFLNTVQEVLIEGPSRRSDAHWMGRTTHNTVVVFPKSGGQPGELVEVRIKECTSATLIGERIL